MASESADDRVFQVSVLCWRQTVFVSVSDRADHRMFLVSVSKSGDESIFLFSVSNSTDGRVILVQCQKVLKAKCVEFQCQKVLATERNLDSIQVCAYSKLVFDFSTGMCVQQREIWNRYWYVRTSM